LTLMLIEALHEEGYKVELITIETPNWARIKTILAADAGNIDRIVVIPPFVTLPTIYRTIICWLIRDVFFTSLVKRRYDLTITTASTLPVIFSDMLYMHFPDFTSSYLEKCNPKYSHGLRRAYSMPLKLISDLSIRVLNRMAHKPLLMTNSQFSKEQIRRDLNVDALIVYPGIDTRKYVSLMNRAVREDIVVTVSRIDKEKNLDIIPQLARYCPDTKFAILGATDSSSEWYKAQIVEESKRLDVEDRVLILANATDAQKTELFSRAKIYLHTMVDEHFGMSIIEAMSAGLMPLVHESGGPWVDILQRNQGLYGYAFNDIEEAASVVNGILKDEAMREAIARRAVERARGFDSLVFKASMLGIIEPMAKARSLSRRG